MRRLALLLSLALAGPVHAEGWAGFYASRTKPVAPVQSMDVDRSDVCIAEILDAQVRHGIPDNLLLAIGLQEAGTQRAGRTTVWPFAVNAAGEGRMFETERAAQDWVRQRQGAGVRSIDVGCMQINLRWHPDAFASLDEGFDPRRNVDYAARFLKRLRAETGSWRGAAGSYHSRNPEYRSVYLDRLDGNIRRANAQRERLAERVAEIPRRAPEPQPVAAAGVGWGAALGGGTRGTLYSRGEVRSLFAGGPK